MKRTWAVVVECGIGHELNNTISESEFFGPYTKEIADALAEKLNEMFLASATDSEPNIAHTMPLTSISPAKVARKFWVETSKQKIDNLTQSSHPH